ncbi:MAG: CPBP family intramembrane glutamic endopeptidase [Kofleriaceae bacterium]
MILGSACVTPRAPSPPRPPSPDRFLRAADPAPAVRAAAAAELAADPSPPAVQLLVIMQQRDVDPGVRASAAQAIELRKDPSLDPVLERAAASDPDPAVRAAAAEAHRKLYPWRKRPGTAAGLSLLCPGCGQIYLGKRAEGVAQLGATAALLASTVLLLRGQELALDGTAGSRRVPLGILTASAGQNLWFYSIFDAYRDARIARGDYGYRHPMTRENLGDLASAPFRPGVLASPWVWAGVPLAVGAGLLASYLAAPEEFRGTSITEADKVNVLGRRFSRLGGFGAGEAYFGALFAPVGVGEEALFRGVIQTEMEERFGTYGGLAVASVIFGAVHLLNFTDDPASAAIAVPVISVLGAGLGIAYQRTGYRLETSVAMHFWYDFLLSTAAFAIDPEHQPFVVQYARVIR